MRHAVISLALVCFSCQDIIDAFNNALPDPPPDPESLIKTAEETTRRNAGCPQGVTAFTIDVPLWAPTPEPGFGGRFGQALALVPEDFCRGAGECVAPPNLTAALRPTLINVATQRANTGWTGAARDRFFRLTFEFGGDPLRVRDGAQCRVMAAIRAALDEADETEFFVSREWCAVTSTGVPEGVAPGSPLASWHADHVAVDALPAPPEPIATVALLDTLASIPEAPFPFFGGINPRDIDPNTQLDYESAGTSDHGRGMALLIHEVAGDAALVEARESLDRNGRATVGITANALYAALFRVGGSPAGPQAQLFNLSFGWPPELERRRRIPLDCEGARHLIEDPVGEPVRYILAGMADMDRPGVPLLAIAAAGNRPVPLPAGSVYGSATEGQPESPCGAHRGDVQGFYPAEYWLRPFCREDGVRFVPPLLPVGGHNAQRELSGTRIRGAEAPLVAPSDHVYARLPQPEGAEFSCVAAAAGESRYPQVFTGSSVAAALTTGVAVRVLDTFRDKQLELSGRSLASLLYLMGENLPAQRVVPNLARLEAYLLRRAHLADLADYLDAHGCPDACELGELAGCIEAIEGSPANLFDRTTLEACRPVREGFARRELPAPAWPDGVAACVAEHARPAPRFDPEPQWSDCGANLALCAAGPGAVDRGALGPLPTSPICPECQATFLNGEERIQLDLWISAKYPDASFSDPKLTLNTPQGSYAIGLLGYTDVTGWAPNVAIKVAPIPYPAGFDPELLGDSTVVLQAIVTQDGKQTAGVEPSVLRVVKP